jgi:hypothetical protein
VVISEGYTEFAGFQWFTRKPLVPWLIHKAKTEEPKMVQQQRQTDLTGGYRSDQ